jgi:hypothetical protein
MMTAADSNRWQPPVIAMLLTTSFNQASLFKGALRTPPAALV